MGPGIALRLAFYRQRGAKRLAVVTDELGGCGGVLLEIEGREERGLEAEGDLVSQISGLIGAKLDLTPKTRTSRAARSLHPLP